MVVASAFPEGKGSQRWKLFSGCTVPTEGRDHVSESWASSQNAFLGSTFRVVQRAQRTFRKASSFPELCPLSPSDCDTWGGRSSALDRLQGVPLAASGCDAHLPDSPGRLGKPRHLLVLFSCCQRSRTSSMSSGSRDFPG